MCFNLNFLINLFKIQEKADLFNDKVLRDAITRVAKEIVDQIGNKSQSLHGSDFTQFIRVKKQEILTHVCPLSIHFQYISSVLNYINSIQNEFSFSTNFFKFSQFDNNKMGDAEVSGKIREKLVQDFDKIEVELRNSVALYDECSKFYNDSIQKAIQESTSFLKPIELLNLHHNSKRDSIDKV